MDRTVWAVLVTLLLCYGQAFSLEITSVAPGKGTPGTLIAIGGGPFSAETQPFLGEQYVPPRQVLENQLEFVVPALPPGSYNLTVQTERDVAAQSYIFEVLASTPQVIDIDPRRLDSCSNQTQRTLYIDGQNFLPGALLLVDGKAIPSRVVNQSNLEAQLPSLQPGVYGVAVRNPDGATSLPHSLSISSNPEITSVERGDDFVNSYEIIIHGKNFFFNSTLVTKEPVDSKIGATSRRLTFARRARRTDRDQMVYVDCNTLVYTRVPSIQPNNDLGLQIINPGGQKTEYYFVPLP